MSRTVSIARRIALITLLSLAGCDLSDPYLRPGVWWPNGANEANLRAMVAVPSDLAFAEPAARADGGLAAAALNRLRQDRVRPLLDSGVAQLVPVSSGQAAQQPAPAPSAASPGSGQ